MRDSVLFPWTDLWKECATKVPPSSIVSPVWEWRIWRIRRRLGRLLPHRCITHHWAFNYCIAVTSPAHTQPPGIWQVLWMQILFHPCVRNDAETVISYIGFSASVTLSGTQANYWSTACFLLRARNDTFYDLRLLNKQVGKCRTSNVKCPYFKVKEQRKTLRELGVVNSSISCQSLTVSACMTVEGMM